MIPYSLSVWGISECIELDKGALATNLLSPLRSQVAGPADCAEEHLETGRLVSGGGVRSRVRELARPLGGCVETLSRGSDCLERLSNSVLALVCHNVYLRIVFKCSERKRSVLRCSA